MPTLKTPCKFPDAKARDAIRRTQIEMGIVLAMRGPKFRIEELPDYFLGLLWIEGFKVVPRERSEGDAIEICKTS